MQKLQKLVSAFAIFFLLQGTVFLLDNQTGLRKALVSQSDNPFKCVFDDTHARGFCGTIPAHVLLGHRNATLKYREANLKGRPILVWRKLFDNVDENSSMGGLPGNYGQLLENQSGRTKFRGSRTSEDICDKGLIRSLKEVLDTCCSNGIREVVGGLPMKCIGEETLWDESCGKDILLELIDRFHLTVEYPDQRDRIAARNMFIEIDTYLAEINRKTIGQILNSFWREAIVDCRYDFGTLVFELPQLKSKIYVHQVSLNSLSRFNGYGSVLRVRNGHAEAITDPVKLLAILTEELMSTVDSVTLNNLRLKLNSHILNAVLVTWYKYQIRNDSWLDGQQIHDSLKPKDLSDYSYKLEKFVSAGHPYYPFGKSKVGFSVQDILSYSAEFQPKIPLTLAAIHKSVVGVATSADDFDYGNWFARHFPQEWNHWLCALHSKGMNAENYVPLPIHPWQVTHLVEKMFSDLINRNMLIPLAVTIEVSSTSSLRTLIPMQNSTAPHIKVPVSIQATSSLRAYPADEVKRGPMMSHLLDTILSNESSIWQKLAIVREDIGLYLTIEEERAEHLTAVFRENVVRCCLTGQQIAIPVVALSEKLGVTDTALFVHIMRFAGYTSLKDAIRYFTRYVDLVLGGYLDLYLLYGIALEAHQQNVLAIFENGLIQRFVAKDLTDLRISLSVSQSHTLLRTITTSSIFLNFSEVLVRAQLLHTVYQLHLGELLELVADHFGCSEKFLWRIVRDKTKERFEALKERVDGARWRIEYDAILKADWLGRSYLQNHFETKYVEKDLYHFFKNPLNQEE